MSEYELRAVLAEGFDPANILVNGVAKHKWLGRYDVHGLNVHIDSITEASAIASCAHDQQWNVGLRLHVSDEFDPDEPVFGGQFGMSADEARQALRVLHDAGVGVAGLHFHLRSNVESTLAFKGALAECSRFCAESGWRPRYIDTGGGLPDPGVTAGVDDEYLRELGEAVDEFARLHGTIQEVWMEHGRFVTGSSGVLVVSVMDLKERPECRYLICDGGRTNHALVSDWERHPMFVIPDRTERHVLTTIAGPTCMAFDRLDRIPLPVDVRTGDLVVWTHAGAYHIPWETRFSRGVCRVIWADEDGLDLIRDEENFDKWWGQWV